MNEIPIFFSINDKFAPYLSVALLSLIDHASAENNYRVIVLEQDLSQESKETLAKLATDNVKITFTKIDDEALQKKMAGEHTKLKGDYFTLTIYYRLFIAQLFPQYDKALYLDADIVCNTDLAELYNIDLGDNLLAAAQDGFAADYPQTVSYAEKIIGVPIKHYFNSGVLVLNLKKLRASNFTDRFLALLNKYHFDIMAPDQDYLNAICQNRTLHLDPQWNTTPSGVGRTVAAPQIVHYALFGKPWHYQDAENGQYFWHYAKKSPYKEAIEQTLASFTKEDAQADDNNLNYLLNKAVSLLNNPVTFKKVQEQTGEVAL
jgi:UDP-glucose:(galactosyl)LPS alpha-1,2-glucosyltransferase